MDLKDKVVFITGGARGLGKGIMEALLKKGAKVAFGDLLEEEGHATLEEFQKKFKSENVFFVFFDVTDHQKFTDAFNDAVSHFGHVDIMINNAGVMDERAWQLMVDINLKATIQGTRIATEHMRKDQGGRGGLVINVSSVVATLPHCYFLPVYTATKTGINCYTMSLAKAPNAEEVGIDYSVFCPYAVQTPLRQDVAKKCFFMETDTPNVMTVAEVTEGFMEFVQREQLNGCVVTVDNSGVHYKHH